MDVKVNTRKIFNAINGLDGITDVISSINDPDKADELCSDFYNEAYDEIVKDQVWMEAAIAAAATGVAKKAIGELGKLAVKPAAATATKALGKGVGKSILSRFKTYAETLHPEMATIDKFQSANYDLIEATEKYNIGFKLAMKWGEKLDNRIEVRCFKKNDKPAFAIAYGKQSADKMHMYNTEFVYLDNSFKKYGDFYIASAHAKIGIGHPSIGRMLDKIKGEWDLVKGKQKEATEKRVEEAWIEDRYDQLVADVATGYKAGIITEEEATSYIMDMELAGLHPDDYDWWGN